MNDDFDQHLITRLEQLRADGLYKQERQIDSPQAGSVRLHDQRQLLNFCANNYLGLANDASIVAAAHQGLEEQGFGMASVRFICGTQRQHRELEGALADFFGMQDAILYSSCFDANGGLFETLFDENDAIISDALNHASIIDGIRLCKARRYRYNNNDMVELENRLRESKDARYRLIATDGVFSMDGIIADLPAICELAERYDAMVMVDDSHAAGFVGAQGRGSPEHCGVEGRIDIITGTLGKALGGASGGYTLARRPLIDWLRQRSRPYLFSNSLAPAVVAASLQALDIIREGAALRQRLQQNSQYFREAMTALGFELVPGEHPIIPVMLGDAVLAQQMAEQLLARGVYVVGFSYPVVPRGKARIRTQMSAAHSRADIETAVNAFAAVGRELGVIAQD